MALLTLINLFLAYSKDMQEDKLFDAVDTVSNASWSCSHAADSSL